MKKFIFLFILLFLLSAVINNLFSQTKDTLWTYDCGKYYLSNAVFSPDNQFIYATCSFTKHEVWKFDLQGHRIWVNDSVGGIKQFSEDGRFFWNYYGDKCDANTFQKLFNFADGQFNINGWQWSINEKSGIGILSGTGKITQTQYQNFFDSNLVEFETNTMKITKITSLPNKAYWITHPAISPDGTRLAIITGMQKRDDKNEIYTDSLKIALLTLPELTIEKEINLELSKSTLLVLLKYSPDGSVLGYQHDGKLTLYNTTDYSVIWENDELSIQNFAWSKDLNNLFFSTGIYGLYKLNYGNKDILHIYSNVNSSKFIELNKEQSLILCSRGNKWLYLLNNITTSVNEPYSNKNYQVKLTQTQISNEFALSINANIPETASYTITNMLGKLCTKPLTINLEQGLNQFEVNTTNLPSGTYFLNLTIDNHTQNLKFMVVR